MRSAILGSCMAAVLAIIAAGCAHQKQGCAPCGAAHAAQGPAAGGFVDPNVQQCNYPPPPPPGIPCYLCVYIEEQCTWGCWYDPDYAGCVRKCQADYDNCVKTCY